MQIHSSTFVISSPDYPTCPEPNLTEFAFIGRSNVGKSSLINMLTNKSDLAMVSSKPGKTKLINFFLINKKWSLVDLPGYGYAKASKQQRDNFNEFVSDYLIQRETLSCVFVLIDSRLKPQSIDLQFVNWLIDQKIPFVLVFTKTDKKGATGANIELFKDEMSKFCNGLPRIFSSSSKTRDGRKDILHFIAQALSTRT